jgi:hypothetical protein
MKTKDIDIIYPAMYGIPQLNKVKKGFLFYQKRQVRREALPG